MKTLVSAAAVAALAGSAFGLGETLDRTGHRIFTQDTPGVTISWASMDGSSRGTLGGGAAPTSVYGWDDATPTSGGAGTIGGASGFFAAPAASGVIGVEDYGMSVSPSGPPNGAPTTATDTETLFAYEFVGGVANPYGILFMDFYFNDGATFATGFGVQLPTAGNFIWTITFGATPFTGVPTEGYHVMVANDNPGIGPITTGQWFLSSTGAAPIIGHNDLTIDNGTGGGFPIGQLFALGIPTPGTAALMGLAGLAGLRRRR
jgi:hypothetical protein